MTLSRSPIYSPELFLAAVSSTVVAVHYDREYRIILYTLKDREEAFITRDVPAKAVGKAEKEEWHARSDSTRRVAGITAPIPYEMPFAERMAVISGLRGDPAGGIWVQRRLPNGLVEGPIDLFDAFGTYIGTLPPQQMPEALSASGLAAYIVHDTLGVERVAVRAAGLSRSSDPAAAH
jgi:hypothetical protein